MKTELQINAFKSSRFAVHLPILSGALEISNTREKIITLYIFI